MKEKCNVGHGGHLAFRMNPIGYGDPKLSIKSLLDIKCGKSLNWVIFIKIFVGDFGILIAFPK